MPVPEERILRRLVATSDRARVTSPAADVLRAAYREQLLGIAALDLVGRREPGRHHRRGLADLADAALEAALASPAPESGGRGRTRLAVIAMGKAVAAS